MSVIFPGAVIGGYSANAVLQEQGTDYLYKATVLTGLIDAKTGLLSFWHRLDSMSSAIGYIFATGQSGRFSCRQYSSGSGGYIDIFAQRSTGATCLQIRSTTAVNDGDWHHLLFAWDTSDAAKCKLYLDGVDDTNLLARTDHEIDYASGDWDHGFSATTMSHGQAEFYFTTEWLDITSNANREKFSKNGRPVNLGADGSKPTGTAPLVYFKGPASVWGTNYGTGGTFTVNGTFTDTTKPSY